MNRIAIFASGSGTNFQAIVDAIENGVLDAEIPLLVCDKSGAQVVERAEKHDIPVFQFSAKDYPSKAAFEAEIVERLREANVDWVILAGYMRLIGDTLLAAYEGRIVNIHPSLLPSFAGKDAVGQAFAASVKITGVTIHYVDAGMDTGQIIAQEAVRIEPADTEESLHRKIQAVEHALYVQVIRDLVQTGARIS